MYLFEHADFRHDDFGVTLYKCFCFITFYSYLDVYQYSWYPHVYILHYFHICNVIFNQL